MAAGHQMGAWAGGVNGHIFTPVGFCDARHQDFLMKALRFGIDICQILTARCWLAVIGAIGIGLVTQIAKTRAIGVTERAVGKSVWGKKTVDL